MVIILFVHIVDVHIDYILYVASYTYPVMWRCILCKFLNFVWRCRGSFGNNHMNGGVAKIGFIYLFCDAEVFFYITVHQATRNTTRRTQHLFMSALLQTILQNLSPTPIDQVGNGVIPPLPIALIIGVGNVDYETPDIITELAQKMSNEKFHVFLAGCISSSLQATASLIKSQGGECTCVQLRSSACIDQPLVNLDHEFMEVEILELFCQASAVGNIRFVCQNQQSAIHVWS